MSEFIEFIMDSLTISPWGVGNPQSMLIENTYVKISSIILLIGYILIIIMGIVGGIIGIMHTGDNNTTDDILNDVFTGLALMFLGGPFIAAVLWFVSAITYYIGSNTLVLYGILYGIIDNREDIRKFFKSLSSNKPNVDKKYEKQLLKL